MKAALTSTLMGHPPVTELVGTRVHWLRLPEGEDRAPYVILQEISEREPYHLEGPTGLRFARVQVDAWAPLLEVASAVANAIDALLGGFAGQVADTRLHRVTKLMRRDLGPVDADGAGVLTRVSTDFEVVWSKEI